MSAPGPQSFASGPAGASSEPASSGTPIVPPAAAAAAPAAEPLTPDDVAMVANGVAWFFEFGAQALFAKNPQLFALFPGDVVGQHFPKVVMFVRGSAERVAIKHGIALPYQDEIVCAAALGLAGWGLAMTPANQNGKRPEVTRDVPKNAKNANPRTQPVSPDADADEFDDGLESAPISNAPGTDGDDEELDLGDD